MKNEIKYGYNDINIVPEVSSSIEHRSECKLRPFLFAAPMSSVINIDNMSIFMEQGIIPVIPRNIELVFRNTLIDCQNLKIEPFDKSQVFIALSLEEVINIFIKNYF